MNWKKGIADIDQLDITVHRPLLTRSRSDQRRKPEAAQTRSGANPKGYQLLAGG
jgi:hypothetical protein